MNLEHLRVIDLSDNDYLRCTELSFGDEGYMLEDLDRIRHDERRYRYRYSYAILLRQPPILGWALVQPVYRTRKWTTQLFVDPLHRRKGYGSLLLREANKYGAKPYCFVDDDNVDFFKTNKDFCMDIESVLK